MVLEGLAWLDRRILTLLVTQVSVSTLKTQVRTSVLMMRSSSVGIGMRKLVSSSRTSVITLRSTTPLNSCIVSVSACASLSIRRKGSSSGEGRRQRWKRLCRLSTWTLN